MNKLDIMETRVKYLNFISEIKDKDRKCIDIRDDIISCRVDMMNEWLLDILFNNKFH